MCLLSRCYLCGGASSRLLFMVLYLEVIIGLHTPFSRGYLQTGDNPCSLLSTGLFRAWRGGHEIPQHMFQCRYAPQRCICMEDSCTLSGPFILNIRSSTETIHISAFDKGADAVIQTAAGKLKICIP